MKIVHSLPCCSTRSDATGWSQEEKKIKITVFNIETDCEQARSQRHKVTGACKTLGYISSSKLFFFLFLWVSFPFFFFPIIGAPLAISRYYKALRVTKFHKSSKFRNDNAGISSLLHRSSNTLKISISPDQKEGKTRKKIYASIDFYSLSRSFHLGFLVPLLSMTRETFLFKCSQLSVTDLQLHCSVILRNY